MGEVITIGLDIAKSVFQVAHESKLIQQCGRLSNFPLVAGPLIVGRLYAFPSTPAIAA